MMREDSAVIGEDMPPSEGPSGFMGSLGSHRAMMAPPGMGYMSVPAPAPRPESHGLAGYPRHGYGGAYYDTPGPDYMAAALARENALQDELGKEQERRERLEEEIKDLRA